MRMRDSKGRFVRGHVVPDEWRKSIGEKNSANLMGREAWNKGLKGAWGPNSGSFKLGHNRGQRFTLGQEPWNKGMHGYHSGPNHWHWKGGISSENHIKRNLLAYKEWRKAVFERDEYMCQHCGVSSVYLHAHHIEGFAEKEQLQLDVSNGLTLCRACHFVITFGYPIPDDSRWGLSSYTIEIQET